MFRSRRANPLKTHACSVVPLNPTGRDNGSTIQISCSYRPIATGRVRAPLNTRATVVLLWRNAPRRRQCSSLRLTNIVQTRSWISGHVVP